LTGIRMLSRRVQRKAACQGSSLNSFAQSLVRSPKRPRLSSRLHQRTRSY
jgi:hypothetical protein